MIITAEQKNSRQTPTRLRLVAKAIKKLSLKDAMDQLAFTNMRSARTLLQVFKQVVANATKNLGLSYETLTIKDIVVGEGPRYKRFQPVSRGQAHSILKRTAHVRVVLESTESKVTRTKVQNPMTKIQATTTLPKDTKETPKPIAAPITLKKTMMKPQTTVKTTAIRKTGER